MHRRSNDMDWWLWPIIGWEGFMLLLAAWACGRTIETTGPGLLMAVVGRILITWGLAASGADVFWLWTITICAAFDIATDAFVIGEKVRFGAWEMFVALVVYVGTIALAITAGVS